MGVPKFYRWISERYPLINQLISSAAILPEFDNFYLDMNGIIHACTHPNDNLASNSLTLREMMLSIFRYVDRIVTEIVKPKKLLFLAIDGVAPRAKLNQQRARRFRAAQDLAESLVKAKQRGDVVDEANLFDSNCITPGTEFMDIVSKHLKYFIRKKVKEDPLWQNLTIIFSGHDVPGEGEHKIMQYIRDQRALPNYEPNLRHCMYGQDADLIMLGLASHEPHFALLREVIHFNTFKGGKKPSSREVVMRQTKDAQFQLLHLSLLREYLAIDFAHDVHHAMDKERVIDDFIFLTFLVGNDFLPHLPTLDISEHAFDVILTAYRDLFQQAPGYIVDRGEIADLPRLESLFAIIGAQEQSILANRELTQKEWNTKRRKRKEVTAEQELEREEFEFALESAFEEAMMEAMHGPDFIPTAAIESKERHLDEDDDAGESTEEGFGNDTEEEEQEDSPKAGEVKDYRSRYYYQKFHFLTVQSGGIQQLEEIKYHYLKGLMWCLAYYMKGCISWNWYYPYHYGPMLQDMRNLLPVQQQITFDLGQPFTPYQQLLGCLPPASAKLLPKCYQWLMTNPDSPILDFYPLEFGIDQDGKKNPWEAVILLSFIDEKLLVEAERIFCTKEKLTKLELLRNQFGKMLVYEYDPAIVDNYLSCNPEIGLSDIHQCHSRVSEVMFSLAPGHYFVSALVEGTIFPIAGFPTLTMMTLINKITIDSIKLNIFGSESRYKSIVIHLDTSHYESLQLGALQSLLGRSVFVNYPQVHEAKVVGITSEAGELVLVEDTKKTGEANHSQHPPTVRHITYDEGQARSWKAAMETEENRYLVGRGFPGTGGLKISEIRFMIRVKLLQGLSRDVITGATYKVFSNHHITEIPLQLILSELPAPDPRFEEVSELPLEKLMPVGASVIAVTGQLIGCKGKIVGPYKAFGPKSQPPSQQVRHNRKKVVDVEFQLPQPEAPFGYTIAKTMRERYYSSREVCQQLKISSSLLGKISGSIRIESHRVDFGLNLKRKGLYQLLGYVRKVEPKFPKNATKDDSLVTKGINRDHYGKVGRQIWQSEDVVKIIGMETTVLKDGITNLAAEETEAVYFEYSTAAIALIGDYKQRFPQVFENLERLPPATFAYQAQELFPGVAKGPALDQLVAAVLDWMKVQPFFNLPRTAFTTSSLSHEAMMAIEKAADQQTHANTTKGYTTLLVKGIPIEKIYCNLHRTSQDVSLQYNQLEPRLGDRVVNLCAIGVPFGLRGTVITIHHATKFVEVIFDEEFIGGKNLHGCCSQFRGRLCAWSDLLLISGSGGGNHHHHPPHHHGAPAPHPQYSSKIVYAYSAKELGVQSVTVVENESSTSHVPSKHPSHQQVTSHHKDTDSKKKGKASGGNGHNTTDPKPVTKRTMVLSSYEDDDNVASIDILLQEKSLQDLLLSKNKEGEQKTDTSKGKTDSSEAAKTTTNDKTAVWSSFIAEAGISTSLESSLEQLHLNEQKESPAAVFVPPMPGLIATKSTMTGEVKPKPNHTTSSGTTHSSDNNQKGKALLQHLSGSTTTSRTPPQPQGPKTTLDKKAANRMVKHELGRQAQQPPNTVKSFKQIVESPQVASTTTETVASDSLTKMLQKAKKTSEQSKVQSFQPKVILKRDNPPVEATSTVTTTAASTEGKPVDSVKTAALANLLHKKDTPNVKPPASDDDFDNLPPPPAPSVTTAPPTSTSTSTGSTPTEKKSVKELLSQAKRRMQQQTGKTVKSADPSVPPTAAAVAAPPSSNASEDHHQTDSTTAQPMKKVTHLLFSQNKP